MENLEIEITDTGNTELDIAEAELSVVDDSAEEATPKRRGRKAFRRFEDTALPIEEFVPIGVAARELNLSLHAVRLAIRQKRLRGGVYNKHYIVSKRSLENGDNRPQKEDSECHSLV